MSRLAVLALGALALAGPPLAAQDTVNVIDPDAPPVVSPYRGGPALEVVREAVARYNDSATTRLFGSFTVGSGTWIRGDVAMYRGTLKVQGRISGRVTVVNGSLIIAPGAAVDGEVLLIGGRFITQPGGQQTGGFRTYADLAPVYRNNSGLLEIREQPPSLGEIASAKRTFTAGRLKTTLVLETGRTYNRVEGLPVLVGPTFSLPTRNEGEAKLDLRAIFRTESDPTDTRNEIGWRSRFEWNRTSAVRWGLGAHWSEEIDPIEDQPLSLAEVGWGTFLLGKDYRDYYQNRSFGAFGWVSPFETLKLEASLGQRKESTVPASDPVTVFSNPEPWRPNPLIDDGTYGSFRTRLEFDNRNSAVTPTAGWKASASFEHGWSDDVAPASLPVEVRDPLPTYRRYAYSRLGFDVRLYQRMNALARANLRVTGGGWIGGDPLPVQRRVALGGTDILPGYAFRSQSCAPAGYTNPAQPALCDRYLAVQAEVRFRFRLGIREKLGAQDWLVLERLLGAEQADVVLFGDMGKAWLTGDGPGRVPNNRIPTPSEWDYDLGIGLDFDGLALYLASPTRELWPPRFTVRIQRRF